MSARYRFGVFQAPRGPWRDQPAAARQDALEAGFGEVDEATGIRFLDVAATIEVSDERGRRWL